MSIRDKRTDPHEMDIWVKADETLGETGLRIAVVYPESFCGKPLLEQVATYCKEGYTASSIVPDWLLTDMCNLAEESDNPDAKRLMNRIIDASERIWQE